MSSIVTAYFSATGTTAAAAKDIAAALGAELYEIRPEQPYSAADLKWTDKRSRSTLEMNDPDARPAIAGELPSLEGCDTVFLGFPVWWYVEPRIIDSFIERAPLAGKRVIPFCTSGSSGIGKAVRRMRALRPDADWADGARISGSAAAWARAQIG